MARDKEWEARMQGMIYAFNMAKSDGIEALEKEIKRRNVLRLPLNVSDKQAMKHYEQISANVYNNMLTGMLYALHDAFGFGRVRLNRLKAAFDDIVLGTLDLDYMGEHYVKLEDYAIELNDKYNLDIDANRVVATQDLHDGDRGDFHSCRVERVIKELRENGYDTAADFLGEKLR